MAVDDQLSAIQSRLKHSLAPFCNLQSRNEFIAASQKLPDALHGFYVLLAKTNVNTHSNVWYPVLTNFLELSVHISIQHKQFERVLDGQVVLAFKSFEDSLLLIVKYVESFFRVYQINPESPEDCNKFMKLAKLMSIYLIECASFLPLHVLANTFGASFHRFISSSLSKIAEIEISHRFEIISLVTQACKAFFYCGSPNAILPLLTSAPNCVSDDFVLPLVSCEDFSVELLIDYFKYAGFCLVSCVAEQENIDDDLTRKADLYFKMLLNLPNLQLTNYNLELQTYGDLLSQLSRRYVSFLEREELAFFYVLNRLLMFTSLETFVSTDDYFDSELQFFVDSFNHRVGSELDQLVSVPLSRNGSYVSVPKASEPISDPSIDTKLSLSSILADGSYKERLKLVISFFRGVIGARKDRLSGLSRLIRMYDLSLLSTLQDSSQLESNSSEIFGLISRMDFKKFPGKRLYLKAIDKILRLFQLLALKFYITTAGISQLPLIIMQQSFRAEYTLDQILSVKKILTYMNDRLFVSNREELPDNEKYLHQLDLFEKTTALERNLQKLF